MCCHTGMPCRRHRTCHPTLSQYTDKGPTCHFDIHRCVKSHLNTQLPILKSWVRPGANSLHNYYGIFAPDSLDIYFLNVSIIIIYTIIIYHNQTHIHFICVALAGNIIIKVYSHRTRQIFIFYMSLS